MWDLTLAAAGWEKGQVENQVGVLRKRFFARPSFKTLEDLNAWLADGCIAYAKKQAHPEQTDKTVFEMFEAERAVLMPYHGPFDGFHASSATVSKTCLVRFDRNKYSVNASAVGRPVDVYAYADPVVLKQDGVVVGEHARRFGRDQTAYDPWHYVAALAKKPGAPRNGAPFKDWVPPGSIEEVRVRLGRSDEGDRQMVKILILDELCKVTGWHRKHAVRALADRPVARPDAAGQRTSTYDAAVKDALTALWEASDRICGKRLSPTLLPALERHGRLKLRAADRVLVLAISAATIDRLLAGTKIAAAGGKRRRVGFYSAIRREVPIRTFNDWQDPPPGFCEIDMVAHGGTSVSAFLRRHKCHCRYPKPPSLRRRSACRSKSASRAVRTDAQRENTRPGSACPRSLIHIW